MAKKLGDKDDFRLVVMPRSMTDFGSVRTSRSFFYSGPDAQKRWEKDMQARCEEIAEQIKRHVDGVDWVEIQFDQEHVCEHCGYRWSEDSDTYNGGCCAKDEEANPDNVTNA